MKKLVLLAGILLASCASVNTYCPPEVVSKSLVEMGANWEEFNQEASVADTTSGLGVLFPLGELIKIKEKANQIYVPECLVKAKQYQLETYEAAINAYSEYSGGGELLTDEVEVSLNKFLDEIDRINACLPDCKNSK